MTDRSWRSSTWESQLGSEPVTGRRGGAGTFGLDLFTVGRDDDALDLPELEVLQDLPEPHDEAPLHAGLDGVLVVQAVLEADQLLQEDGDALVHVLPQHLAAVAAEEEQSCQRSGEEDFSDIRHSLSELPAVDFRYICWGGHR